MTAVTGEGRLVAGRYRLLHALGRGGMGTVWRAHDTALGVDRALKEIRFLDEPSAADRHARAERARREARAAARLATHPGVVVVHDLVEERDAPWIVMELLESCRSLDQVVRQDGPLPAPEAARVALTVVEALDHGHRHEILHRDVKPANVLIAGDGRVKIADFGIATYLDREPLTLAGSISGTPTYMAPERLRKDKAGPASDLFSLGATLYAAVEGRAPFPTATDAARFAFDARFGPPRPQRAGPLLPVLDGLMTHDPGRRLSATSAVRMLREIAGPLRAPRSRDGGDTTTAFVPLPAAGGPAPGRLGAPLPARDPLVGGPAGPTPAPTPSGRTPTPAPSAPPSPYPPPGGGPPPPPPPRGAGAPPPPPGPPRGPPP
ncbi:serine/threonine protein kinase, partial [Frankia sp. CN7]|nr:serine/threonine protein kinase [Frankia nepalensis]